MHFVIGDVHGHHRTLMALLTTLPDDAIPIFVGDLIDRGKESAKVVSHVREFGYACVIGNHEEMMCSSGEAIISAYETGDALPQHDIWFDNGGIDTLRSYGLVKAIEGRVLKVEASKRALRRFADDIRWMRSLPLYLELDVREPVSDRPVIISHAPIMTGWDLYDHESRWTTIRQQALTNRRTPKGHTPFFNIFGHTPIRHGPEIQAHHINIDTGCYIDDGSGYGRLCAYCVETGEVICQENIG
jgi:serine/threonine protein phosphatase 1